MKTIQIDGIPVHYSTATIAVRNGRVYEPKPRYGIISILANNIKLKSRNTNEAEASVRKLQQLLRKMKPLHAEATVKEMSANPKAWWNY